MLLPLLVLLQVDPTPEPDDVKAGPVALVIFLALIAAVVFLGFSLVKQLRKAQAAEDAGVYGHDDDSDDSDDGTPGSPGPSEPENHSAS
jgi:hypothetical protein